MPIFLGLLAALTAVYFFVMRARNAAEETFIMLGGSGYWQTEDTQPDLCKTGDIIHYPSYIPHVSVTKDEPFIAAWRWTGDIGYDQYTLTG